MKPLLHLSFLRRVMMLLLCSVSFFTAKSQTTLAAGDIAFTGYNSDNTSPALDTFSFVIIRAGGISSATTISFTDNGWLSGTSSLATNEGVITWTTSTALAQGTQVKIAGLTALVNGVSSGTVANTSNAASGLSLATTGDQVLAFQGSSLSPTFVAGIHMNVCTVAGDGIDSDANNWDGSVIGTNRCAKPPALTTGTNATWFTTEVDNARYNCTVVSGTTSAVTTGCNTPSNWTTDDVNPYVLPSLCTFFGSPATVTATGTLSAFSSCAGTASSSQSFTVGGSNLTANIVITAPTGFEVSTTSGSGYGSSVTLTPSSGTVSSTTIYARLSSSASGTPSGNITCASTGATTQNVSASGTVNALPTITLGSVTSVSTSATSFSLPYSATTGSPNQYSIAAGAPTAMPGFSAVNNATLSSSPVSVTIPASSANTYNFVATVRNSTTGCVSGNNNFTVTVSLPSTTINSIVKGTPSSAKTNATSVTYNVTFGASITGLTTSNFSLTTTGVSGASITSLSGSGASYSVIVNTGTGSGSITLNLNNATGLSNGISTSLPFAGETYTIDKTNPTVVTQNRTVYLNAAGTGTLTAAQVNNGSSDASGIASLSINTTNFTCANVGTPVTVTLTVTDSAGNSNTGTASITVSDTVRPVVVTQNRTVYLSAAGTATVSALQLNNGTSDACGVASLSASQTSYTCANVGTPVTVTLTATDLNGNTNTGTATVTVLDTVRPVVVTQNRTVYLNAAGTATVSALQLNNGTSDACGVASLSASQTSYTCANVGTPVTVTLTATDLNGNTKTGTATVTVLDTVRPVVVTQNRTVYLSAAGTATVSALQLNNGTSDACGVASLSASQTSYTCANVGTPVTVTLTATDLNGNTNTGTATVTVLDTVRPVVVTQNRTVYLNAAGTATVSALQLNNGTSDACGVASLSASQTSYTCANVGTPVTVTLTATDLNGNTNTGTATVTVLDTVRPVVVTQNRTVYLNAAGTATVSAAQVNNGSSDACGVASLSLSQTSFTCANVGTPVTVTLTVTDVNSNSKTGTATITVLDTVRPVVVTQNRTVYLSAAGTATVSALQLNNGTSDACGVASLSASQTSYTCANVGTPVTVTLTATDLNGNTNTGTATVTVLDTVRPVVVTQNRTVYLSAAGTATVSALQLNNGTSDACGVASLSASQTSYTCANVGTPVTVTLTATDLNGNTNTGTATVTVLDTVRPVVVTQNRTVYLNAAGTATVSAAQVNNGSSDACGVAALSLSQTSFTCANVGTPVTVTLTVTDVNSNSKTGTATITVLDTVRPVVVTQNRTVYLSAAGTATVSALQLNNGTSDACGVASLSASQTSYTCANVGTPVTVTLTATDLNSNTNTGTATVTVLDTVRPVVVTQNRTVYLSAAGTATVSALQLNNGTSDACGVASLSASQTSYTCANVGTPVTVTLTATDLNGNTNTGTATVTVLDTVRPVVVTQNRTVYLSAAGTATVSAAQVNNGSSDACGVASLSLSQTSFNCANIGANTVTLTVTDVNSNSKTGTATVTVVDTFSFTGNALSSSQTICSGSAPAMLTGPVPTGGNGVTYTYTWLSSTTSASAGFAAATGTNNTQNYSPGALTANTWYKRRIVSSPCNIDTSSAILITVNPAIAGNTIGSNQSILTNTTPSPLTGALPTGGNGSYTYGWLSSTTSGTAGFSAASGTNNTQNYSPGALTQNTWYRRRVSSGSCSDTSTAVAITVNASIAGNTISSPQTICSGSTPAGLTGGTPTGGTGIFTYAWLSSTTSATVGFTAASGTNNGQNYTPGALTQNTWYRRYVVSGAASDTSAAILITVNAPVASNTASGAQTICSGSTPAALTGSTPTGGTGTFTYTWLSSTTSASTGFAAATGTNNTQNYTPGALTANTWYKRRVSSGACNADTSAAVAITVNPVIAGNTASGGSVVCNGNTTSLTGSAPTGGSGSYTYSWLSSTTSGTTGFGVASGTSNAQNYTTAAMTNATWFRRLVTSGGCSDTSAATQVTITNTNTWTGATSTSWTTGSNWSCGTVPTASMNIVINSGTPNMPVITDLRTALNVTINTGATLTLSGGGASLVITGVFTNNGTFNTSTGKVTFNGSTPQIVPPGSYNRIEVNNTAGVTLGGNITLSDTLFFVSGTLSLGNNSLTLNGTSGRISGADNTRFIVINGTGSLNIQNLGTGGRTGNITFPVGTSTSSYTPVTLNNTGTSDEFRVRVVDSVNTSYTGQTPGGSRIVNNVVHKTWFIDEVNAGGSIVALILQWNGLNEAGNFTRNNCYVAHFTGGNWIPFTGAAASGAGPYTQTRNGITSFSPFSIGGVGSQLPVVLTSFEAKAESNHAVLTWTTASEVNNDKFVVESSTDGHIFNTIGEVKGKGNSSEATDYLFTDMEARKAGISSVYYRLLQVDADGTKTYSDIRKVTFNTLSGQILVTPNPFETTTTVTFAGAVAGAVQIKVTDITGKLITETSAHISASANQVQLHLESYKSGIYFIHASNANGETSVIKVVKQ